jgi:hypothetical protein
VREFVRKQIRRKVTAVFIFLLYVQTELEMPLYIYIGSSVPECYLVHRFEDGMSVMEKRQETSFLIHVPAWIEIWQVHGLVLVFCAVWLMCVPTFQNSLLHLFSVILSLMWLGSIHTYFTRWRSWLCHCATILKVAFSIPDGVIEIFYWHNPSGRTMALGLTQPLTEMSNKNISLGIKAVSG